MKTSHILAFLIIYGFHNSIEAQSPLPLTSNPTKSEITLFSSPDNMKGVLYLLKDSSILVSNSLVKEDYFNGNYEVEELYIDDINLISTKRRGGKKVGVILGALVGLGVGGLAAIIAEPPPTPSSPSSTNCPFCPSRGKVSLPGPFGSSGGLEYGYLIPAAVVAGGITGGIIGGLKVEIPLNGSMENYNRKKKKLGRYTVNYSGAPKY